MSCRCSLCADVKFRLRLPLCTNLPASLSWETPGEIPVIAAFSRNRAATEVDR